MDDDTENKTADAFEETAEAGRIEDEFEILTMDSDESKAEPQISELKEAIEEGDPDNAFEKTIEKTAEPHSPESCRNEAGKTADDRKVVECSGDTEDGDSKGAVEGDEDDKAWDSWNSWTNWGTSVINTAASSVTTFTSQVGDGLIQVLETVESGLLVQDEEEEVEKKELKEGHADQPITDQNINPKVDQPMERGEQVEDGVTRNASSSGIGSGIASGKSWLLSSLSNVVSKTTSVVQQTTNVVVHGGLDMLETIGKKTYDVITEGDHGLKKVIEKNKQKRQMPNLSQVLKEAREIANLKCREEESLLETKKFLYSYWFDEYQGLVQLEAFELLANQNEAWSRKEYDRLPKEKLAEVKRRLAELNEIYKTIEDDNEEEEADDKQDFNQLILDYAAKLPVNISVQKLVECEESCKKWLDDHANRKPSSEEGDKDPSPKDVLKKSMQCLAQLTALSIQHFHKLAQLITKTSSSPDSPLDGPPFSGASVPETARVIIEFSKVLCREFSIISGKFATTVGRFEESSEGTDSELSKEVSEHITTVYLETSNSTNFVQRSLKLLLPALQVAVMTGQ